MTRAQFERLTEALQPGMSPSLRLNVAHAYARNLRMSAAAEKRSLDKTPAFEEEMRYARMQLLAQDLNRDIADGSQQHFRLRSRRLLQETPNVFRTGFVCADFCSTCKANRSTHEQRGHCGRYQSECAKSDAGWMGKQVQRSRRTPPRKRWRKSLPISAVAPLRVKIRTN